MNGTCEEPDHVWVTRGFDGFSRGTCGNAGQNLYVSRAGVLQRIHQYDLDGDGYLDLIFCNSQNNNEQPPVSVYRDPLGDRVCAELASDGAMSGAVADLNGDGYDDLVLGMWDNGIRRDLNAVIYYGSPQGLSESRQQRLPAPSCSSVAVGDINGDRRPDLVFLCSGQVRIFYQSELGFEPKRFVDLEIYGDQLALDDLDGDGYADLIVRSKDGGIRIYWGGQGGIDPEDVADVPLVCCGMGPYGESSPEEAPPPECVADVPTLPRVVHLWRERDEEGLVGASRPSAIPASRPRSEKTPYLFVPQSECVALIPIDHDRRFGSPLVLNCPRAVAIATGDVNGDGHEDLVLACREEWGQGECSWIYWGSEQGFDESRKTRLASFRACDVAVGDIDGDGCDDIVLCQSHTDESLTTESLIYRGSRGEIAVDPVRFITHDARRAFIARPSEDGRPQVIFVNASSRNLLGNIRPAIYSGGPDGFSPERRQEAPGWGAVEAVSCDVNDDGYPDLVLANAAENSVNRDPGSYVLLNGPCGFPDEPTWRLPTTRAHGVCCADINRDGHLDLIFCGFNNPDLLIFYGTAEGFDVAHPQRIRMEHEGTLYKDPRWIYLADLNDDGWLDLVVPQIDADRSFILWGGPDGFSMDRCQMLSVFHAACARAADLTGNGYLDLIIGGHTPSLQGPHDSFVYIYWNGPDGLREDRRTLLPSNAVNAMAVADFNNDGLLDLFVCSYHDGRTRDIDSYIYWNRPGTGFRATDRTRLFTHSASGCVAADFNEDGWIDLAIAYHKVEGDHVGHSAVWWNGPDGFDDGRVTRLPTSGPHGMVAVGPGNLVDRGPEEYYASAPFKLPEGACVTAIEWEALVPPKTWVKAQLRFADTREGLEKAAWIGSDGEGSWFGDDRKDVGAEGSAGASAGSQCTGSALGRTANSTSTHATCTRSTHSIGERLNVKELRGRWVGYRLALGAVNGGRTPRVTEVKVYYG